MARRRGGFGYIVPKGGLFAIRWREGTRSKQRSGFKTRTEAAEALARVRVGLGDGTLVEKRRAGIGFADVAKEWLRLHSAATLRSHDTNEKNYRVHVAPFFGDTPLSAITGTRILEFRAHLQAKARTRRVCGPDGVVREVEYRLSVRTVNHQLALVRKVLRFAVASGHVNVAATERLGRGRLMLRVTSDQLAPPIGNPRDVGRLLEAIRELRPDRYGLFATLVYLGLRKGEALGLRWSDVDLERRRVTVRHSYAGPTKNGRSREVPIPSPLVEILRRHRLEEPYQGELAFPDDAGEGFTRDAKLGDVLRAGLARCGLPQIRLHDLRHTHAAHFLMAGGSLFDLQKNLGHASVAFTAAVYGHLSADHRVKESDRLAGLFDAPTLAKVLQFEKLADGAG